MGDRGVKRRTAEAKADQILRNVLDDIEAWAEGDVLAADGEILRAEDLAEYLSRELAPFLMSFYEARLSYHRTHFATLRERVAAEAREIAALRDNAA